MARIQAAVLTGALAALLLPPRASAGRRGQGYSVEGTLRQDASPPGTPAAGTPIGDGYHPFSDMGKALPGPAPTISHPLPAGDMTAPPPGETSLPGRPADPYAAMDAAAAAARASDVRPEDAAANFQTVVETFLAQNARDGAWPYKEKGRTMSLELVSADSEHLKKKGNGLFAGSVVLRDVRTKRRVTLEFTADFSGPEWTVTQVKRPAPPAAKRR